MKCIKAVRWKSWYAYVNEYIFSGNPEANVDKSEDSEPKPSLEEGISERRKMRRQKNLKHKIKKDKN